MEVGRNWNVGQFECAERCLLAAVRTNDRRDRQALGRAGLKYLAGALGICSDAGRVRADGPASHTEQTGGLVAR